MGLVGRWLNEDEFHTPPKELLTYEQIYDREPDRTDKQAVFIMKLMMEKGYKRVEDVHNSVKLKSNGKISIGVAAKVIDYLLKK